MFAEPHWCRTYYDRDVSLGCHELDRHILTNCQVCDLKNVPVSGSIYFSSDWSDPISLVIIVFLAVMQIRVLIRRKYDRTGKIRQGIILGILAIQFVDTLF